MAKCIMTDKVVRRVEDEVADKAVREGKSVYVTKEVWKKSLTPKQRDAIKTADDARTKKRKKVDTAVV